MKSNLITSVALIASLVAAPALAQPDQRGDRGGGGPQGGPPGGESSHSAGPQGGGGPHGAGGPAHGGGPGGGAQRPTTTGPAPQVRPAPAGPGTHERGGAEHQGWTGANPGGGRNVQQDHNGPGRGGQPGWNGPGRGPSQGQTIQRGSVTARGSHFTFQGRSFSRARAPAFRYPRGYAYRRWRVGARLPHLFLRPIYFFTDYALFGFGPPPYGEEWVRYGPDLLLVDIATGEVVYVIYGAFY